MNEIYSENVNEDIEAAVAARAAGFLTAMGTARNPAVVPANTAGRVAEPAIGTAPAPPRDPCGR